MSKVFFFVRHGITQANQERLWCGGEWDIELATEGKNQARELADLFLNLSEDIDHILVSPMLRAQQTAHLLNHKKQLPISSLEVLREWRIGELEKTPWVDPLLSKLISHWPHPPGGESVKEFSDRVQGALKHCLENHQSPLLVSHGAFCRVLLDLMGIPDQHIPNCCVFKFSQKQNGEDNEWSLERI